MPSRTRRIRAATWLLLAPLLMGKFQGEVPGCAACRGAGRAAFAPIAAVVPQAAWSESAAAGPLDAAAVPGGSARRVAIHVTVDQDPAAWQPFPVEIAVQLRPPVVGARDGRGCCTRSGARACIVVDADRMNGFAGAAVQDLRGSPLPVDRRCFGTSRLCRSDDAPSCTGIELVLERSLEPAAAACDRRSGRCTIDLVLVLTPNRPPPDGYRVVFVEEGGIVRSVPYAPERPDPVRVAATASIRGPKVRAEDRPKHPKPAGLELAVAVEPLGP